MAGAEVTVSQAERMLRALIHFIIMDLETKRITRPPIVDEQVKEISGYLRKGREQQDRNRNVRKTTGFHGADIFYVLDTMLGRISDIVRVLVQNPLAEEEYVFSIKALRLITRCQERIFLGSRLNLALLKGLLEQKKMELRKNTDGSEAMYQLCTLLLYYLEELEKLQLALQDKISPDAN